ncbi:MAG: hypothetical protein EOM34_09035 [Clostridia bacterium]|nr:hypothetical protein [Clostridia bacterium]NCD03743.1 hypothetical protein [Clostridia bacterium]
MNGVGETHKKHSTKPQQHKKNHNTTTKIHSTKLTIKTNQPLMRVEKKIEVWVESLKEGK